MRAFPANGAEWSDVVLVPFKVYSLVMFFFVAFCGRQLSDEPMLLHIALGYLVCLIVVTWMAMVDTFCVKCPTTNWRWSGITLLGFLCVLKWLLS